MMAKPIYGILMAIELIYGIMAANSIYAWGKLVKRFHGVMMLWYGHVSRLSGLAKTILQGTVKGKRRQGRQKKRWEDNIREWTGLEFEMSQRAVDSRQKRRKLVVKSFLVSQ